MEGNSDERYSQPAEIRVESVALARPTLPTRYGSAMSESAMNKPSS